MVKPLRLWGIIFSACWIIAMAFSASAQGPAQIIKENVQTMTYEVYAGGINAVTAEMKVSYDKKDRYHMDFSARTQGFLGKIVPWEGSFETEGWRLKNGQDMPEMHKSTALWRGEKESKEYTYGKDGTFKDLLIMEEGRDKSPKELQKDLTQGTTDALTAMLMVMEAVADQGTCEGTSEVFDGKRRFEMSFTHESEDTLSASRYNSYEGLAARCNVEVKPVAGAWHKKPRGWLSIQEQGREQGSMPTVWMAAIDETGGPAVPVKVRVKTSYGTLFMHLVGYTSTEKTL